MSDVRQPPVETVYSAPLQVNEKQDVMVVEIRDERGNKIELKRFRRR
jgi:hypothetical protein